MNQAVASAPHRNARLVRLLAELAMIEEDWPHKDFADRLGQMLSFADSIVLADAHKVKPERGFVVVTDSCEDLKQAVLHTKTKLVNGVIQSCAGAADRPKIRWPDLEETASEIPFERYHRFYLSHQRDQDLALRVVRSSAREALTGCTPALKKLAVLDRALEDTLWDQTYRMLALIPRLLQRRFNLLQQQAQPGWLQQFRKDVQALLLAELDLRLQPVLGLVEALEREVSRKS